MSCINTLQKLADSAYQLACIETDKPFRMRELFQRFSTETGCAVYEWIEDSGLRRIGFEHISIPKTRTPADVFSYIATARHYGIYLFAKSSSHFNLKDVEKTIVKIQQSEDGIRRLVVLLDNDVSLPESIAPLTMRVRHKTTRPSPQPTHAPKSAPSAPTVAVGV